MTGNQVLLWDFDGTLGQRPGRWSGTVLEVLDAEYPGHGYQRAQIAAVLSSGFPWHTPDTAHPHLADSRAWWHHLTGVLSEALLRLGLSPSHAQSAARLVPVRYTDPARWEVFADTVPALAELTRQGWRHAVLSNHVPELPRILQGLGLDLHVDAVVNSAVTGYEKPHPEAFRLALAATGHPDRVWMIGDNPAADVAGAHAVGLNAILVRTPNPGVPHYAPDLATLPALIAATETEEPSRPEH
ncbi:hypothetical protein BIV57_00315 [Mangrovactinospora gilvigrisea]|uniref:Hydrolase n=1 Tax=Mangrovactinospora gilvigrisea TaxID=1428644 RepID=A0A1J7CCR2_9ACTN|nr:HAD family hydrolase [Mangrovactinospora gilvigrisea]OIV39328.1 hypothetical protein BIV57_00315 [Mangrovactinospora gilvigrisea]